MQVVKIMPGCAPMQKALRPQSEKACIPAESRLYPGEALGDYAPRSRRPAPEDDLTRQLDATDAEDLPF